MRFRSDRRASPEITLTSLIDILFIVLVFLVLTTTFRESRSFRLALPEAATGERVDSTPRDRWSITIDAYEQVYFQDEALEIEQLEPRLRAATAVGPDPSGMPAFSEQPEVLLAADARVSHGRVVAVMDVVRKVGIRRLRIETIEPATP